MPYPEEICIPMREDLTNVGFVELKTAEQVSDLLERNIQKPKKQKAEKFSYEKQRKQKQKKT